MQLVFRLIAKTRDYRTAATMGRPVAQQDANFLTVIDERTGQKFRIPIVDNAIDASAFKKMKAARAPGEREENEVGLMSSQFYAVLQLTWIAATDRRWTSSRGHWILQYSRHLVQDYVH